MNEVQQFCRDHHPCEEGARFALRHKTLAEVWANCERGDWLWWMLRARGPVTKKLSVMVAIACAERVLCVYEAEYPNDNRPRKAIDAARAYLRRPCKRLRSAARSASWSAWSAWSAASSASSASWSAAESAAMSAESAAMSAESAAMSAESAASSAESAASSAEGKWQADKIRELVGSNPFV